MVYYVLHGYAKAERDVPETGELISFRKLYGGIQYYDSFRSRVLKKIEKRYGMEPQLLIEAAIPLGGIRMNLGDVSVKIYALPRIPIIITIWAGDEEFPPSANIFFDSSILNYLNAEETTVLCELVLKRLSDVLRIKGKK